MAKHSPKKAASKSDTAQNSKCAPKNSKKTPNLKKKLQTDGEAPRKEMAAAELAEWIGQAIEQPPGPILLLITEALESGAPNEKGAVDPIALAAWLLAEQKGAE